MKRIVQVTEVEGEGLEALLGKKVTLYCSIYIYSGKLVGINSTFVMLEEAEIVYDTGSFESNGWSTSEKFPHNIWYVQKQAIESFGELK